MQRNEINFEDESDAEQFKELIAELARLHKEKEEVDAFISQHNQEVEKN